MLLILSINNYWNPLFLPKKRVSISYIDTHARHICLPMNPENGEWTKDNLIGPVSEQKLQMSHDSGNFTLPLKEHYLLPTFVFKKRLLFIYVHTTQMIAITLLPQDSRFLPTNNSTMNLKEQRNACSWYHPQQLCFPYQLVPYVRSNIAIKKKWSIFSPTFLYIMHQQGDIKYQVLSSE